jgi:hypothetical protein
MLYYLFVLMIFGYIVGYNFLGLKSYRKLGDVVGTARFQLYAPSKNYTLPASELAYCNMTGGSNAFPQTAPCRWFDAFTSVYPPIESDAVFLSTRITFSQQTTTANCVDPAQPSCANAWTNVGEEEAVFVAQPELYTVLVDHAMAIPEFVNVSRTAEEMEGAFLDRQGLPVDPCQPYARRKLPCPSIISLGKDGTNDIIAMETILEAAGVESLDTFWYTNKNKDGTTTPNTARYAGLIIILVIDYDNMGSFNESAISYTYTATAVSAAEYKAEQVWPEAGVLQQNRSVIDRHGIRLIVSQAGTVGRFDATQLLIVAVTSLGLLAVSNSIVDFLAFNVLKMRFVYSQYRMVTSVDFSEISHLPERVLKSFETADQINPRPAIFAEFETHDGTGGMTNIGLRTHTAAAPHRDDHGQHQHHPDAKRPLAGYKAVILSPLQVEQGPSSSSSRAPAAGAVSGEDDHDDYEEFTGARRPSTASSLRSDSVVIIPGVPDWVRGASSSSGAAAAGRRNA